MLEEILGRLVPQAQKYKVYTALLTQSGTDAPVATVLENTLGRRYCLVKVRYRDI